MLEDFIRPTLGSMSVISNILISIYTLTSVYVKIGIHIVAKDHCSIFDTSKWNISKLKKHRISIWIRFESLGIYVWGHDRPLI